MSDRIRLRVGDMILAETGSGLRPKYLLLYIFPKDDDTNNYYQGGVLLLDMRYKATPRVFAVARGVFSDYLRGKRKLLSFITPPEGFYTGDIVAHVICWINDDDLLDPKKRLLDRVESGEFLEDEIYV